MIKMYKGKEIPEKIWLDAYNVLTEISQSAEESYFEEIQAIGAAMELGAAAIQYMLSSEEVKYEDTH